jgi:hypothetical protein
MSVNILYQTTAQHSSDESRLHAHHRDKLVYLPELRYFDATSFFFISRLNIWPIFTKRLKDRKQLVAKEISDTQIPAINNINVEDWGAFEEEPLLPAYLLVLSWYIKIILEIGRNFGQENYFVKCK